MVTLADVRKHIFYMLTVEIVPGICYNLFLTEERRKEREKQRGTQAQQGFKFFCQNILTVMVCYGIIKREG